MKPVLNNLANGRRLAVRSVVMTALASFSCVTYRKEVIPIDNSGSARDDVTWGGIGVTQSAAQDDHAINYDFIGNSRLLLLDPYGGGNVLNNDSMVDMSAISAMALIEPYDLDIPLNQWAKIIPAWEIHKGDIVGMILGNSSNHLIFMEIVEVEGTSAMADYGRRYKLNKRDDLNNLEPFSTLV
jgi:hypothetical protein